MDLSLRAYIKGWKAIFLDDVTCLNEVGGRCGGAAAGGRHRPRCASVLFVGSAALPPPADAALLTLLTPPCPAQA